MPVPRPRSAMRKIREILRLALGEGLSRRATGAATGLPYTTVSDHLARAARAGLGWPLPDGMDDAQLEARLFARAEPPPSASRPLPDWPMVHRELRRKGMTLQLLHMEYKERQPDGYQYTQFCRHYRAWARHLDVVMRQEHRAGEKLFVDFAGQTISITDPATGEITQAQLFVAVLGASSYTYAEALPSQELPHWIAAHVHAFSFLGGCTRLIVPDNLRSGVTRAHRYEPDINPTYAEMAAHYGAAVIPARPRKPRDKAKAESGVLVVERWILAALRHRTFFSIAEANEAIAERLAWLNARPFKKLPGSRLSLFAELDRPALRPLPAAPYEFATWKTATVNIDYHVLQPARTTRLDARMVVPGGGAVGDQRAGGEPAHQRGDDASLRAYFHARSSPRWCPDMNEGLIRVLFLEDDRGPAEATMEALASRGIAVIGLCRRSRRRLPVPRATGRT